MGVGAIEIIDGGNVMFSGDFLCRTAYFCTFAGYLLPVGGVFLIVNYIILVI